MKATILALVIAVFGVTSVIQANEPAPEGEHKVEHKESKKVKKSHDKHGKKTTTTEEHKEHKEEAAPAPAGN